MGHRQQSPGGRNQNLRVVIPSGMNSGMQSANDELSYNEVSGSQSIQKSSKFKRTTNYIRYVSASTTRVSKYSSRCTADTKCHRTVVIVIIISKSQLLRSTRFLNELKRSHGHVELESSEHQYRATHEVSTSHATVAFCLSKRIDLRTNCQLALQRSDTTGRVE